MEFKPHSEKQAQAIFSEKPIVVAGTGIQYGKTTIGAVKCRIWSCTYTHHTDNFLVLAPTYKIMSQSTLPAFLKYMDGTGTFAKVDMVYRVHGGGQFIFRTASDPNSIVGVTDVRGIWGDEAGLFSLYFWENIQVRSAFREAQIVLTTSPYALNWIYRELIRPARKEASTRPDVELVQAASWENPYMPRGVIDRARNTMDARRFNALFGGQWERMAGLVYDCFDDVENICAPMTLPNGTRFSGGIDWGYTEPSVFTILALVPDGRVYVIAEFYRAGLTVPAFSENVIRLCRTWSVRSIAAGPDQPASIALLGSLLHKAGLRTSVSAADNSVRRGVDRVYELIKTRTLKVFRGMASHLLDEIDTYHYPEPIDLKPDQDAKDLNPVKQNDHALDSLRYAAMGLHVDGKRLTARVPGEKKLDHYAEWEVLKKDGRKEYEDVV